MKRMTVLFLAAALCLWLVACSKEPGHGENPQEIQAEATDTEGSEEMQQSGSPTHSEGTAEESGEPAQQSIELAGPWHLDSEKNDLAAFADSLDLFPGYGEWGASMEIRSDGQMSWYIGAEGWHGTYTVEDGVIHAQLTSDLEQSTQLWDFHITEENGVAVLEMNYQDMTVYWAYGDQEDTPTQGNEVPEDGSVPSGAEEAPEEAPWKTALAEDLFEKYGVLPEYYEALGDGISQVYVEVGGEVVPFVTADSATADYHG